MTDSCPCAISRGPNKPRDLNLILVLLCFASRAPSCCYLYCYLCCPSEFVLQLFMFQQCLRGFRDAHHLPQLSVRNDGADFWLFRAPSSCPSSFRDAPPHPRPWATYPACVECFLVLIFILQCFFFFSVFFKFFCCE